MVARDVAESGDGCKRKRRACKGTRCSASEALVVLNHPCNTRQEPRVRSTLNTSVPLLRLPQNLTQGFLEPAKTISTGAPRL